MRRRHGVCAAWLALSSWPAAQAGDLTTLHVFGPGYVLGGPQGGLVEDASGTLYGATASGRFGQGSIFSLTPPASPGGAWTFGTVVDFRYVGPQAPNSPLVSDGMGGFLGTAAASTPGFGSIFRLVPPPSPGQPWQVQTLYTFRGGLDGETPYAPLTRGSDGAFYGTTDLSSLKTGQGFGTVFRLTPPAPGQTSWAFKVLWEFEGLSGDGRQPFVAPLVRDVSGRLFGITAYGGVWNNGSVFMVTPPIYGTDKWVEQPILSFQPQDGLFAYVGNLVAGPDGSLIGAVPGLTSPDGRYHAAIFQLLPPSADRPTWQRVDIWRFDGASANPGCLTADGQGGFYGAAQRGGAADDGYFFHLTPPAAGSRDWQLQKVSDIAGPNILAGSPLLLDQSGVLFGVMTANTGQDAGSVFALQP